MIIYLFGSTGKVGRLILAEAKRREIKTICFEGDVRSKKDVNDFFKKNNQNSVVVSALGSWGTKNQDILTLGMMNIIPAMKHSKLTRIISLTGSETRLKGDSPSLSSRLLELIMKIITPKVYNDGQKHLELLAKTNLNWVVIRSPKMKNGEKASYHLNSKCPQIWQRVNRRSIAAAMLDCAENKLNIKAPFIHI